MALTDVQVRDLMGLGFSPFQVNYLRPLLGPSGGGGIAGVISVKDFGAVGDGVTDDTVSIQAALVAAFGPVNNPNGSNTSINKQLYFPPGFYKTTAVLNIPPVIGGVIRGAGRFTTTIQNNTNSGIFSTNGFNYSTFSDMQITTTSTTAIVFDHNHDGLNHNGVNSAFFCNFTNLYVNGGSIGMQVGAGGTTCSDSIYTNCLFQNNTVAGVKFCNFNSLDHVFISCAFDNCTRGIYVAQGSVAQVISGGFAQNSIFDIQIDNGGGGGTVLSGVRTESTNFIQSTNNAPVAIQGCGQSSGVAGVFAGSGGGDLTISSCTSGNGQITFQGGSLTVQGFQTGRNDWIALFASPLLINISGVRIPAGNLFDANTTFAMLPSAVGFIGTRGFIKDATVSAYGAIVSAGGGTNKVGIRSDNVNWVVG